MSKLLLILGSGPRIGAATAAKFSSMGYEVVTASRSPRDGNHVVVDLSVPEGIEPLFTQVEKQWGAPSVVVWIASYHSSSPGPLQASLAEFNKSMNINTISPLAAAQAAFKRDPKMTFLYTGNILNERPINGMSLMGTAKAAVAYWIKEASTSGARTYYCDQRTAENGPTPNKDISGSAHAEVFARLATSTEREDPIVTFTP